MKNVGVFTGTILVVVGGVLGIWRRKRKFDRLNAFGVEQFSSYWGKLGSRTKDGLLGFGSLLLFSAGLLILASHYVDSWGWAVLLPVYLLILYMMLGT